MEEERCVSQRSRYVGEMDLWRSFFFLKIISNANSSDVKPNFVTILCMNPWICKTCRSTPLTRSGLANIYHSLSVVHNVVYNFT